MTEIFPTKLTDILGYTGGSMLAINVIPQVLETLKDNVNIDFPERNIGTAVYITNVIGASCLTIFGVLLDLTPIYVTMPIIAIANLLGIILKIGIWISNRQKNRLY